MRVGLALSGGSVRGAAHIGVLKCLHDHSIRPSVISGASAGSIVASLYASGLTPADLERTAMSLSASKIVDIHPPFALAASMAKVIGEALGGPTALLKWAPSGVIRGRKLEEFLRRSGLAHSFEHMELPCVVATTQLDNGRQALFTDQRTAEVLKRLYRLRRSRAAVVAGVEPVAAVRASCAIPGIFTPKSVDGMQLVDGGVKDNLPLTPLDMLCCDVIIGVDLGYSGERREGIDNIAEVVSQSLDIMAAQSVNLAAEALRKRYRNRFVRVQPRIYDVGLFDTDWMGECIDRGYAAMERCIGALRRAISSGSLVVST